jgi:putative transcriptional regulator
MTYTPIEIDRNTLTIMGVPFADRESLESTASAIGSNMFEGFVPTPFLIEVLRDFVEGKISRTTFNSIV